MEVGKQVLAEGMLLCLFCYFCPKQWPLVLLAEADSDHHLHLAAGPPAGTRQIPCSETSPNSGPSPSSWVPMIRSCLPAGPAPGSSRDLPGPLQHLWSVLLTRPWLNRMVVLHGVITEPRRAAPGEQGNGGVQRGWSPC